MMPLLREKTRPVTTSQLPHSQTCDRIAADSVSRRRTAQSVAAARIRAAGISHEICVPNSEPNIRVSPVEPHIPPPPGPPPPPTLPVSLPVSRPRPLYPNASCNTELLVDPPTYGRAEAGVSSTAATHQPAATTTDAPAANSWA